jgi:two-component sensor histidine kinase
MRLIYRVTAVVIAGLVPVIAMEIYNSLALHQARRVEVEQSALRQAELAASEIDRIVEGMKSLMTAVAQAPSVRALNAELCGPFLNNILTNLQYVTALTVVDTEGQVRCAPASEQLKVNVSDRAYFQQSQESKELVVGEYLVGRVSGKPALPFALPILDDAGKSSGAVISSLNLQWLSAQLLARGLPEGSSVTIADRQGTIIARQPKPLDFVGKKIPDNYLHLLAESKAGVIDVVSQDGTSRVLGYIPVGRTSHELYVSAGLSSESSFGGLNAASWRQALITLISVLFSLGCAIVLGRFFVVKPLTQLTDTVHQWQTGDLSARTGLNESQGEVGKLGQEFDRTMDQLSKRQEAIDVLIKELAHRSKNQLTLMMGLTNQLAREKTSVDDYRIALSDRLLALSASQELLLANDGHPVPLESLIVRQLASFTSDIDNRIHLDGPNITIAAENVRALGMAIHELATNATKHGALSNDAGEIDISWKVMPDAKGAIEIRWAERNGPSFEEPQKRGFGRTLIEKIVPLQLNGEAQIYFGPGGLVWILKYVEAEHVS